MRKVRVVVAYALFLPMIIVVVSHACIAIGYSVLTPYCIPVKLVQLVSRHLLLAVEQRSQGLLHVLT